MHILCQILRNTVVDENTGIDRVLDKTRTITGAEATVGHMNSIPPPPRDVVEIAVFHSVLPSISYGFSALRTVMLAHFS